MADQPPERGVLGQPPFRYTGLDLFGNYYVKIGRSQVKRYGIVFRCMISGCVHLEVAANLDTTAFMNAFRRFQSRRPAVKYLRSDQGSNFLAASKENFIGSSLAKKGIAWQFNPPYASHHSGLWERVIKEVRKTLDALLKENSLTDDGLSTLFCEIESILNSRPITTMSGDPKELNPLTTNHLLSMGANEHELSEFTSTVKYATRRWKYVQFLLDQFWRRFRREYLLVLQRRQKWPVARENLKKDDVVLLHDESTPLAVAVRSCC